MNKTGGQKAAGRDGKNRNVNRLKLQAEKDDCGVGEGGQECRWILSKGRRKAITRFDKMHMGNSAFSAFSSREDRQEDMGIIYLVIPEKNYEVDCDD